VRHREQAHTAEAAEGRELAKGKPVEHTRVRTQCRSALHRALARIRAAARRDRATPLTALWPQLYDIDRLREAYDGLNRDATPGGDGQTGAAYGDNLEANLRDLSDRLKRGTYHASPVERVYIPKPEGRQRPIGIPTLEDKIVQRATVEVLNAIYEGDFLGFSYGFRPGRSPHEALDAVTVEIEKRSINWVLAADIRGFLDRAFCSLLQPLPAAETIRSRFPRGLQGEHRRCQLCKARQVVQGADGTGDLQRTDGPTTPHHAGPDHLPGHARQAPFVEEATQQRLTLGPAQDVLLPHRGPGRAQRGDGRAQHPRERPGHHGVSLLAETCVVCLRLVQGRQGRFPATCAVVRHQPILRLHPLVASPGHIGLLAQALHGIVGRAGPIGLAVPPSLHGLLVAVEFRGRQGVKKGHHHLLIDGIGAVSGEPGALIAAHDPHLAQGHLGQEGSLAISPRGALCGAPQVGFDHRDARIRPAAPVGMVPHGVWQRLALGVGQHLMPRRRPDVAHRFAVPMVRLKQLGSRQRSPHRARWSGRRCWTVAHRWGGLPTRLRVGLPYAPRAGRRDHLGDGL
jgi:Reverse transcriptase (RNA-dependent DNA polymerase)